MKKLMGVIDKRQEILLTARIAEVTRQVESGEMDAKLMPNATPLPPATESPPSSASTPAP